MEKIKEEMLEKLRAIKEIAQNDLKYKKGYEKYEVKNVTHYNKKVELVSKETGEYEIFDLCVVLAVDPDTKEILEIYYLDGEEADVSQLMRKYEAAAPIKDVIDATKENEEKPEEEKDSELTKEELEELEREKEEEKEQEIEEEQKINIEEENEKIKPSNIIEKINVDKAKMDYWKTIKQAFGLPEEVDTIAFSYPESSADKVNYANITVHMLDKDGNIIDDLDVNDYFEFDSSTGNNPMSDNVVRHEEDENKGKAQVEENRTMIRLKAKNGEDNNTYISLEQKNGFGDYNDINAGRKVVAGTQNVEKQLETDRLKIWDSQRENIVKSNAGKYNMNEIFDEAQKHKEHGDDKYIDKKNADGKEHTIEICEYEYVPGTEMTWEELSDETGESISKLQDRFQRELEDGKEPSDILAEIEYDYEMTGHEHEHRFF